MRNCALRAARMGKHKQHKQHPPVVKDESESDIDASDLDLDDFAEYVATLPESGDDKEKFLRKYALPFLSCRLFYIIILHTSPLLTSCTTLRHPASPCVTLRHPASPIHHTSYYPAS